MTSSQIVDGTGSSTRSESNSGLGAFAKDVPKVYSAPRRFDLATMFVAMILYSLLFGGLTAIGVDGIAILVLAGWILGIAVSQAALFHGAQPRVASAIAGGFMMLVLVFLGNALFGSLTFWVAIIGLFISVFFGTALGYMSGTLVGGLFLFADLVRKGSNN